ncbi:MAG: hypothetical protein LBB89_13825 [Treponema sp.]|jgi:hypothetical protein|nr:hypothetical protein [Treponema sp.]
MRKLSILCILAVFFMACSDVSNSTRLSGSSTSGSTIFPIDPSKPADPVSWFSKTYEDLVKNKVDESNPDIADYQYVCTTINNKWGAGTVTLEDGTGDTAADCKYLLEMIDKINGDRTDFGTSRYATTQIVNEAAVDYAVKEILWWVKDAQFVVVGLYGYTAHSKDGSEWTEPVIIAKDSRWHGVTYGNGKFVAVGRNTINGKGVIAYSEDGIDWTVQTVGSSGWNGITCGKDKDDNDLFVAVGGDGYNGGGRIAYSEDGIDWEILTAGNSLGEWDDVTCGKDKDDNDLFVAVGNDNTRLIGYSHGAIAYSTDGINWTEPQKVGGGSGGYSVTFHDDKFAAFIADYTAYSEDGINWTTKPIDGWWNSVIYGSDKFAAVGSNGAIASSIDGINWTTQTVKGWWNGVTYGSSKFVAVGSNGAIASSIDGINWTPATKPVGSSRWYAVTCK